MFRRRSGWPYIKYSRHAGATIGEAGASAKTHRIATPVSTYILNERALSECSYTQYTRTTSYSAVPVGKDTAWSTAYHHSGATGNAKPMKDESVDIQEIVHRQHHGALCNHPIDPRCRLCRWHSNRNGSEYSHQFISESKRIPAVKEHVREQWSRKGSLRAAIRYGSPVRQVRER
jgi:hypothetical protein